MPPKKRVPARTAKAPPATNTTRVTRGTPSKAAASTTRSRRNAAPIEDELVAHTPKSKSGKGAIARGRPARVTRTTPTKTAVGITKRGRPGRPAAPTISTVPASKVRRPGRPAKPSATTKSKTRTVASPPPNRARLGRAAKLSTTSEIQPTRKRGRPANEEVQESAPPAKKRGRPAQAKVQASPAKATKPVAKAPVRTAAKAPAKGTKAKAAAKAKAAPKATTATKATKGTKPKTGTKAAQPNTKRRGRPPVKVASPKKKTVKVTRKSRAKKVVLPPRPRTSASPDVQIQTSLTVTVEEPEEETGPSFWLMKAEPEPRFENGTDVSFSIDALAAKVEPEAWDGVRNAVATNNMKSMKKGELAFFYHSNCKVPGIVGLMEIVEEAQPDESAFDPSHYKYDEKSNREKPRWFCVKVAFKEKFPSIVPLKELQKYGKDNGILSGMQLLRLSRLSVSKVSKRQWDFIMDSLVDTGTDNADHSDRAEAVKAPETTTDGTPPDDALERAIVNDVSEDADATTQLVAEQLVDQIVEDVTKSILPTIEAEVTAGLIDEATNGTHSELDDILDEFSAPIEAVVSAPSVHTASRRTSRAPSRAAASRDPSLARSVRASSRAASKEPSVARSVRASSRAASREPSVARSVRASSQRLSVPPVANGASGASAGSQGPPSSYLAPSSARPASRGKSAQPPSRPGSSGKALMSVSEGKETEPDNTFEGIGDSFAV